MYVTFSLMPRLSRFQWCLIYTNKLIVDIAGHCGKDLCLSPYTMKYFFAEPFFQYIKLSVQDHDRHHTRPSCNFGSRLSLWDKVFGTYV